MIKRVFLGICLPLLLIVNLIPGNTFVYAESDVEESSVEKGLVLEDEYYYLLSDEEYIPLYSEQDALEEIHELPNEAKIQLVQDDSADSSSSYQLIYYEDKDNPVLGYVEKDYIMDKDTFESAFEVESEESIDSDAGEQITEEDEVVELDTEQQEVEESDLKAENSTEANSEDNPTSDETENEEEDFQEAEELTNESEEAKENKLVKNMTYSVLGSKRLKGVAKRSPTNIRQDRSTKSKVIKKLPIGTVVHYERYSKDWFKTTVVINGKTEVGYLHRKHVTTVTTVPQTKKGVAKKSPTNLRTGASTKSKVLTRLPIGEVINYRTFSKNWNEVTVTVNGRTEVGYLHRKHVTNISTTPQNESLFTLRSPTNVRAGASTKSKVLTTLSKNQFINVKTFSKNWYSYTTTVNGRTATGYIHRKHAENVKNMKFKGIAGKVKTNIRQKASTKSSVLTSLSLGTVFEYTVHNNNWYKVTVSQNGRAITGYIHKKHMIDTEYVQQTVWGQALKERTNIRTEASTKSKVLARLDLDEIVRLKTFSNDWYEATVKVNGVNRTGYIHRKHFTDITNKNFTGMAGKTKTNIRQKASTKSPVLTSIKGGTQISYKLHNTNWYKTTVNQNGNLVTGYIHKKHMQTKKQRTVVVDPGHGGKDPGATGNGLTEKNLTLDISKRVESLLRNAGYDVIMTRSTDEFIALQERTNIANNSGADIFLSIHINSFSNSSVNGLETWWYDKGPYPNESKQLATEIQNALAKDINMSNRGVKSTNLHVNRESKLPSALVELGFISNKSDTDKLKNNSFKNSLASAIVKGIKNYFGK